MVNPSGRRLAREAHHTPPGCLTSSPDAGLHPRRFLISHGAEVETEDMDGRTPLHAAAIWGHDDVIRMLAKRNAYLESTP